MTTAEYAPQSLTELRQAYPRALVAVFDPETVKKDKCRSPVHRRDNCLDCEDGVRLVVSRVRLEGSISLHVAAYYTSPSRLSESYRKIRRNGTGAEAIKHMFGVLAYKRFCEISDETRKPYQVFYLLDVYNMYFEDLLPSKIETTPIV